MRGTDKLLLDSDSDRLEPMPKSVREAFDVYVALGAGRSCVAVARRVGKSPSTIQKYCWQYQWQTRLHFELSEPPSLGNTLKERALALSERLHGTANDILDGLEVLLIAALEQIGDGKLKIDTAADLKRIWGVYQEVAQTTERRLALGVGAGFDQFLAAFNAHLTTEELFQDHLKRLYRLRDQAESTLEITQGPGERKTVMQTLIKINEQIKDCHTQLAKVELPKDGSDEDLRDLSDEELARREEYFAKRLSKRKGQPCD